MYDTLTRPDDAAIRPQLEAGLGFLTACRGPVAQKLCRPDLAAVTTQKTLKLKAIPLRQAFAVLHEEHCDKLVWSRLPRLRHMTCKGRVPRFHQRAVDPSAAPDAKFIKICLCTAPRRTFLRHGTCCPWLLEDGCKTVYILCLVNIKLREP